MTFTRALTASLLMSFGIAHAADISVASNSANVPFEFEDKNGQTVGFEVDLLNLVAARLKKTVEFTSMPFNALFSAVQSGRADVAIGSITITKKRLESVAFAQPFYDANQCLTVMTGSAVKGLAQLKDKSVGVITGSTGEIWASENNSRYGFADIRRFDGNSEPMLDLQARRIDGYVHDCPIDAYYIRDKPQYAIVATIPTNEEFGFMLPKNSKLLKDIDDQLSALKQSGEIQRLHEKWFGKKADADSSTVKKKPLPTL